MMCLRSWDEVDRAVRIITPAGPMLSSAAADAAVVRLRRAGDWALEHLDQACILTDTAREIADTPILVVDRHGLVRAMSRMLQREAPPSLPLALGGLVLMRRLSGAVQEFWCPVGSRNPAEMLLVAPNVWQTATELRLDQEDYAKWVALRSGLWGVCFTRAPWLADHLWHSATASPRGIGQLAQTSVLLSQLILAQLERLTPEQIPSINWIRCHVPSSNLVHAVERLRGTVPDMVGLEAAAHSFVHSLHLHEDPDALGKLFTSAAHLPTAEELRSPRLWANRVRID